MKDVPTATAYELARELMERNTADKLRNIHGNAERGRNDRSVLLRMAGNIAAGVLADQSTRLTSPIAIANAAVDIATLIIAAVDKRLLTDTKDK
jgi:hypothetical protein